MNRIEQAKKCVYDFIGSKKQEVFLQLKNSYERYILYQYIKSHKLKFETIESNNEYMKYRVVDFSLQIESLYNPAIHKNLSDDYYTKPIKYIRVYKS